VLRVFVQSLKVLTIVAVAVLVGAGGLRAFEYTVGRFTPEGVGEPASITIAEGENADVVADRLAEAGLIRSKFLFTTQMQVTRQGFTPGTYQLRKGMSAQQIIDRVTRGETELVAQAEDDEDEPTAQPQGQTLGGGDTFEITIPEGWRIEQIAEEYENQGGEGGADAFMEAVSEVDRSRYEFLASVPADASLEGFLFPDTYNFVQDDPAANVTMMLDNFGEQVPPEWLSRADEMGDLYTVVTLASIVEREAAVAEERPVIAGVYLNRLEQGWRLDADPTIQYAIGERDGEWWSKLSPADLEQTDSPYNTYKVDGLPPGPIASPGKASIQAVLFPEETDYMYFVAIGDGSGEHAFAVTEEEQNANINRYRQSAEGGE
jgi:UPF0755 protein